MSRTYAHNSAVNDPEAEPHSFDLEGATARIIEKNVSAGEFVFEIETWAASCSSRRTRRRWRRTG